jgi:hypothetical protein
MRQCCLPCWMVTSMIQLLQAAASGTRILKRLSAYRSAVAGRLYKCYFLAPGSGLSIGRVVSVRVHQCSAKMCYVRERCAVCARCRRRREAPSGEA